MVHDFCFEKEVEKGKIYKIKRKEMTKGGSSLNLVGLGRYGSRYLSYISTYWFADLKYWRNIEGEENEAIKIIHERLPRSILDSFFFQFSNGKNSPSPPFKFLLPIDRRRKKRRKFRARVKSFTLEHSSSLKAKKGRKIKEGPFACCYIVEDQRGELSQSG